MTDIAGKWQTEQDNIKNLNFQIVGLIEVVHILWKSLQM